MTEEQRYAIFKHYWSLSDLRSKRKYIADCLDLPKYEFSRERDENKRVKSKNYLYHFRSDDNQRVKVCKTFFQNTLNISNTVIGTVKEKLTNSGNIEDDKRGKYKRQLTD